MERLQATCAKVGAELVASVPEVARYAQVRAEQVVNVPSPDITPDIWRELANRINGR